MVEYLTRVITVDSVDSRSMDAVMLRMWLGDLDQNSLSVLLGADFMVSGDWMFLALSAMGRLFSSLPIWGVIPLLMSKIGRSL